MEKIENILKEIEALSDEDLQIVFDKIKSRLEAMGAEQTLNTLPLEYILLRIWNEALGKSLSLDDDLFEVGVNTRQADEVMERVSTLFRLNAISHNHLFSNPPTVRGMARALQLEWNAYYQTRQSLIDDQSAWTNDRDESDSTPGFVVSATAYAREVEAEPRHIENDSSKDALASEKRELFERLLEKENFEGLSMPLAPRSVSAASPLSFSQQRLWFIEQLSPGNIAYNIPAALRLTGRLDVTALKKSFQEIGRRHEILRTTFRTEGGDVKQLVSPRLAAEFHLVDLTGLWGEAQSARLQGVMDEEFSRPFDLASGPLMRITLVRLEEEERLLLLTMHHIISDGWSMGVLNHELWVLYEAFKSGKPSLLPELPIQFADYAVWQREPLQAEALEEHLGYWRLQLAGAPTRLDLPTDYDRPMIQTYRGESEWAEIPESLTAALRSVSRGEGATLFMILLAAFNVLLQRYTGQSDIVVGTPIANRNRPDVDGLIGFFVNTLALRIDSSGDPTFPELLRRVRETCLGAYSHQDTPFEKIVEQLQPDRDPGYSPVFQVMFTFQNSPIRVLDFPGLQVSRVDVSNKSAKFDLVFEIEEFAEGLKIRAEYNADLFKGTTVRRMLDHYRQILERVPADPEQRLSEMAILSETEDRQLLYEWNDTRVPTADRCLPQLFEDQVASTPEAVALVCEGISVTYRELNERANQLAHYLRSVGVRPETIVGILLPPSIEMVVAILGIHKAGGAYLPLDPVLPQQRLYFMMADTGIRLLLTRKDLTSLESVYGFEQIYLDEAGGLLARESTENLTTTVQPANLAYVIYTSGSTGTPKGVLVRHQSVTNLIVTAQPLFKFDKHDVWTLFHSTSFDFSVWELWGALCYGGKLVIVPRSLSRSPAEFLELLTSERVTVLNQTPTAFRQLIKASTDSGSDELTHLRLIILGGEKLAPSDLGSWIETYGAEQPQLFNLYGITETTVHTTFHQITKADLEGPQKSIIGRPLPNCRVYILDDALQPVPIGVAGEMYVAGAGLARGYLNRPHLTADRFIVDPFAREPGARLYRTGDLCRRLADGDIEFLGRTDNQVKVHGYRIELGEVEAVMLEHESVRECVVVAVEDSPRGKSLVAYVVCRDENTPSASELRSYLNDRLPEFMIPADFVLLGSLPLTSNGKIDRRALPAPAYARPGLEDNYIAPRTSVEATVAGIWADILGLERVGIHDNFFELGGHSLLAVQVISRIRESLDVDVSMHVLFESPTVAAISAEINQRTQKTAISNE